MRDSDDREENQWNSVKVELVEGSYPGFEDGFTPLSRREKELAFSVFSATLSTISKYQWVIYHDDIEKDGSNNCNGPVEGYLDDCGDLQYKCDSCDQTWTSLKI